MDDSSRVGEEKTNAMDVAVDGENLELLQQVSQSRIVLNSLRTSFEAMIELKRKDASMSSDTTMQLAKLRTRVHLLFLELKQLNRTIAYLGQSMKASVQVKKISQNQVNLDLQGLLYERSHFEKEIHKCQDFKPVADEISLIAEQEFYALTSSPPLTNPHSLMVARLEHEVKLRQQLLVTLDEKRSRQAQQELMLVKQRETAQDIRKHIMGVLGNVAKLETQLPGSAHPVTVSSDALKLPKPLFTLYNVLCCQEEYYQSGFKVSITPEPDTKENGMEEDEIPEKASKRSKKDPQHQQLKITPHEMCVLLTTSSLDSGNGNNSVNMLFRYLLPIGVVSVTTSGPGSWPNMLTNLYTRDDGTSLPSNLSALDVANIHVDTQHLGTPYRWLQALCGLHFSHPLQSLIYLRTLTVGSFLTELQTRATMRASLRKQLSALQHQTLISGNALDDLPQQPKSFVSEWTPSKPDFFFHFKSANNNNQKENGDEDNRRALDWFQTNAEYYHFRVSEAQSKSSVIEGVVEIPAGYPTHPPSFRLGSHKDAAEIEVEVNRYFPKTLRQIFQSEERGEAFLLSYQLKKIMVSCDLKTARDSIALCELLRSDQSAPFLYETGQETNK